MADPRPYVINGNALKILNSAPVLNMRPSLGSLVQRQTIDIGCYPFPFMVNEENIPLDGRTVVVDGESVRLETRPVPGWCSENTYAKFPGDATYNNGKVVWVGNRGYIQSNISGSVAIERFTHDPALGISYPNVGLYNTAFLGMDNTVPVEWMTLKDLSYAPGGFDDGVTFGYGPTYDIANNVLFKAWSGLTFEDITDSGVDSEPKFAIRPMIEYSLLGGTFSPFLDRYNYGCLEQIFNSPQFATIAVDPNEFWEGTGLCFGESGGLSGPLFFLNALTGGDNAGSYFIFSEPDFPYSELTKGTVAGQTLTGKQLALNLYKLGNENPYLGPEDPAGGFVDTMALLLGTSQKIVNLRTGLTASLRALDFNNPCSASWVYRDDTELGRWGYQITKIPLGEDAFDPGPPPEIGCNVSDYIEYVTGATGKNHGIVHPLSWMFWKGISAEGSVSEYRMGYIHDYAEDDEAGQPIYTKLEGIHDYLCYEYENPFGQIARVYYPLRPITSQWYNSRVRPAYSTDLPNGAEARAFGATLDTKYDTGFPLAFRDTDSSSFGSISLRILDEEDATFGVTIEYPQATSLNGVTGVLFPYLIPIATNAMQGIESTNLQINGEFNRFADWSQIKFNTQSGDVGSLYQYYADGVSSAADFTETTSAPFSSGPGNPGDFRLFSWNALSRIRARNLQEIGKEVRSSFQTSPDNPNGYGSANYKSPNTLVMDGSAVNVNPEDYPPYALPSGFGQGLTYSRLEGDSTVVVPLDCGSFVNVIRYANITPPSEGGLAAKRELIARVTLGGDTKNLLQFETGYGSGDDGKIDDPNNVNFRRDGGPNTDTNFYSYSGLDQNFFFTTDTDDLFYGVFTVPYYLTRDDWLTKYGQSDGADVNQKWWENIDTEGLLLATGYYNPSFNSLDEAKDNITSDIFERLTQGENKWVGLSDLGFRSTGYVPDLNGTMVTGIRQAIEDGVHPAFIYRLLTTNVLQGLEIEDSCFESWRSGGVPCHQIQDVETDLKINGGIYNSYFSGNVQCGNVGNEFAPTQEEFDANKGKDIFGRCMISIEQGPFGPVPQYAYDDYWFSPFPTDAVNPGNPYYVYQNVDCAGSAAIQDPPQDAALSSFGLQFAEVLKIVEGKDTDLNNALAVREELFAYPGSTAIVPPDTTGTNNVGDVTVADWLNGKLESILTYWNTNRTEGTPEIAQVESLLQTLYPNRFSEYRTELANLATYSLWAIKPACVEEWTPECADIAQVNSNNSSFRFAAFAPSNQLFRDEDFNSEIPSGDRTIRPTSIQTLDPVGSNTTPLTMGDIITQNEGFISAFNTVYIEPLGLAENVLATEAQAVPRATISSTVLGKISTIIDSDGFLRDVNVISIESGFGVKILGNNDTGSITVSVDGLSMGSLTDTGISGPQEGDILVYDAELAKWVNRPFSEVVQPFLAGFTGFTGSFDFEAGTNFFYQDSAPDAGVTIGSRWMNSNTGIEYIYINDGDTEQWIQSSVEVSVDTPTFTYNTTLVSGPLYSAFDSDYYIGVSYDGPVTITLPTSPEQGKTVVVKDARGMASRPNNRITIVGAGSDTIDNEESAIIATNNGALQFIYKNGWRII